MKKMYLCKQWPGLRMSLGVKFKNRLFTTEDPRQQVAIEETRMFQTGVIVDISQKALQDPPPEPEPLPATISDVDFEFDDPDDEDDEEEDLGLWAEPAEPALPEKPKIGATQVNHMNVPQLRALADSLGLESWMNGTKLRREIKHKLGV